MSARLSDLLKHEDILDALIGIVDSRRKFINPLETKESVFDDMKNLYRCLGKRDMCDEIINELKRLHNEAKQKDQTTQ